MESFFINPRLRGTLHQIHNFHNIHGVTVLYKEPESWWKRLWKIWLKIAMVLTIVLLSLTSTGKFSDNSTAAKLTNFFILCSVITLGSFEGVLVYKKQAIFELIEWCNKVEVYTFRRNDMSDWFGQKRENVCRFIR